MARPGEEGFDSNADYQKRLQRAYTASVEKAARDKKMADAIRKAGQELAKKKKEAKAKADQERDDRAVARNANKEHEEEERRREQEAATQARLAEKERNRQEEVIHRQSLAVAGMVARNDAQSLAESKEEMDIASGQMETQDSLGRLKHHTDGPMETEDSLEQPRTNAQLAIRQSQALIGSRERNKATSVNEEDSQQVTKWVNRSSATGVDAFDSKQRDREPRGAGQPAKTSRYLQSVAAVTGGDAVMEEPESAVLNFDFSRPGVFEVVGGLPRPQLPTNVTSGPIPRDSFMTTNTSGGKRPANAPEREPKKGAVAPDGPANRVLAATEELKAANPVARIMPAPTEDQVILFDRRAPLPAQLLPPVVVAAGGGSGPPNDPPPSRGSMRSDDSSDDEDEQKRPPGRNGGKYITVNRFVWNGPLPLQNKIFKDRDLDEARIGGKNKPFATRCREYVRHIPAWDRYERLKNIVSTKKYDLQKEHVEAALCDTLIQLLKSWLLADFWDPLILCEVVVEIANRSGAAALLIRDKSTYADVPYVTAKKEFNGQDRLNTLFIIVNMLVPVFGAYSHAMGSLTTPADKQGCAEYMFGFIDGIFCRLSGTSQARFDEAKKNNQKSILKMEAPFKKEMTNVKDHIINVYFGQPSYQEFRAFMLRRWTETRFNLNTVDDDTLTLLVLMPDCFEKRGLGLPIALIGTTMWPYQRAALLMDQLEKPRKRPPGAPAATIEGNQAESGFLGSLAIAGDDENNLADGRQKALWAALRATYDIEIGVSVQTREQYLAKINALIDSNLPPPNQGSQSLHRLLRNMRV